MNELVGRLMIEVTVAGGMLLPIEVSMDDVLGVRGRMRVRNVWIVGRL